MSNIARPDCCSADFQTYLERHFTRGRISESPIRQVWKPTLLYHRLRSGKTSSPIPSYVLFCFLTLRFRVRSPCRHCRHCSTPDPGKEKQKCYDYRCGVLIFHKLSIRVLSSLGVMRKNLMRGYAQSLLNNCPTRPRADLHLASVSFAFIIGPLFCFDWLISSFTEVVRKIRSEVTRKLCKNVTGAVR